MSSVLVSEKIIRVWLPSDDWNVPREAYGRSHVLSQLNIAIIDFDKSEGLVLGAPEKKGFDRISLFRRTIDPIEVTPIAHQLSKVGIVRSGEFQQTDEMLTTVVCPVGHVNRKSWFMVEPLDDKGER